MLCFLPGTFFKIPDPKSNIGLQGDRFYLTMPSSFDITANDADYTVVSKTLGLDFGEMTLRAMVGDVYGN